MNYYYTNFYQSYKGQTRNIIYILDEEERMHLADSIAQLIKDRDTLIERGVMEFHYTKNGKKLNCRPKAHPNRMKKYWNGKDEEAVEFLKRICIFTEYPESVMLDPTDWQLEGMVDKMLVKIYGPFYGKFANWLEMDLGVEMNSGQVRNHMDYKRKLFANGKKFGHMPNIDKLPY